MLPHMQGVEFWMSFGCSAHYGKWKREEGSRRFRKEKHRSFWKELEDSRRFQKVRGATEKMDLFWKVPWKMHGSYGTCKVHGSYTEAIERFQVWSMKTNQVYVGQPSFPLRPHPHTGPFLSSEAPYPR
eukprot:351357-Chlamydomonas_euryale.AAC.4